MRLGSTVNLLLVTVACLPKAPPPVWSGVELLRAGASKFVEKYFELRGVVDPTSGLIRSLNSFGKISAGTSGLNILPVVKSLKIRFKLLE